MDIEKGKLYLMPVSQGVIPGQALAKYRDVTTITALYLTDKDAMAAMLPSPFEVPDEPIVTVSHIKNGDVDFIPDGGYNIFCVNLSAVFNGKKDTLTGSFAYILWEDHLLAIASGREVLGVPKIFGDIPDPVQSGNDWHGQVFDNGNLLGEVFLRNAVEADAPTVQMIEQIANSGAWMSWKYIPSCNWMDADVSKPILIPTRTRMSQAFTGEPEVGFNQISYEKSPIGHQIMEALATLKVKEYRGGIVARAESDLLIGESRMLE